MFINNLPSSLRVSCPSFPSPGKIVWPPSPGPAPLPSWSSFTQSRQVCSQTLGSTMWLRLARGRYIHFGFIWINLQSLHVLDTLWCSIWFKQPNVKSAMCMFFLFGLHSCTLFFFHKVYVTQWQPFPLPSNGMENPDTWQELVQVSFWWAGGYYHEPCYF